MRYKFCSIVGSIFIIPAFILLIINIYQDSDENIINKQYEWCQNKASQLSQLYNEIRLLQTLHDFYYEEFGINKTDWPQDIKEGEALVKTELESLKARYNYWADEYNAIRAKFNFNKLPAHLPRIPIKFRKYE